MKNGASPDDVVAKVLDYDIALNMFKFQQCNYARFLNILRIYINYLIPQR